LFSAGSDSQLLTGFIPLGFHLLNFPILFISYLMKTTLLVIFLTFSSLASFCQSTTTDKSNQHGDNVVTEKKVKDEIADQPLTKVDQMPEYKGGDEARVLFLMKNLNYPKEARKAGISGIVFVTFIVERDGSLSDVKVLGGIGGGCDKETVRVVKRIPPGYPERKMEKRYGFSLICQ